MEQLVEVPTEPAFVEQTVDIPVPRGRGRRLQGFHPEQSSTVSVVEQKVDNPVPGGGLQGSRPGQGSAASSSFSRSPAVLDDADEAFEVAFRTFPVGKSARVAGQMSAQLGGHVSSSTLSAHQVRVAAHSSPSSLDEFWVDGRWRVDTVAPWPVDVAWLGRERLLGRALLRARMGFLGSDMGCDWFFLLR